MGTTAADGEGGMSAATERPHYTVGVVAPCDRCGECDVLVATERDYMDEVTEESCRACVEGWDDEW